MIISADGMSPKLKTIEQRMIEPLLEEANFLQLVLTKDHNIVGHSDGLSCPIFIARNRHRVIGHAESVQTA